LPLASARGQMAPVAVPDMPNLLVAGDWVGDEGMMLLDAVFTSATRAAELVLGRGPMRNVA